LKQQQQTEKNISRLPSTAKTAVKQRVVSVYEKYVRAEI
jgi:hypothetical protein